METKRIDINHLQHISTPTTIKTSKNWVLPPRPRPGRKPNQSSHHNSHAHSSSSHHHHHHSHHSHQSSHQASHSSSNPAVSVNSVSKAVTTDQLALSKLQNENQMLKQQLSKLVTDLKVLQQDIAAPCKKRHIDDDEHHQHNDDHDETSSQVSNLSLLSSNSNLSNSHSCTQDTLQSFANSLTAINEEPSLIPSSTSNNNSSATSTSNFRIDDFIKSSYFDDFSSNLAGSNSISKPTSNLNLISTSAPAQNDDVFKFEFLDNNT